MDESGFIGIFGIKHDKLFLFVAIFLEDLLLSFEVLFIEGLVGIKVTFGIEASWFYIFLVGRIDFFLLDSLAGFGNGRLKKVHTEKFFSSSRKDIY